ncbi:hypothetical protein PbB2_00103 [Candidatus Phycosocius bacilliformis]|uniref:Uncharacterized protein n=1 Tax=Candidatus Phycosocius bacilliformis TaxID=1445552 RepID=A0A2P2E5W1_9PROT|nr:hypothetical protein [Candidatus Phycosocius bacilliformis]GBF56447.1 hypothetical protein PbB2_00103 [Candidatus Phycosocius bacilliformis]
MNLPDLRLAIDTLAMGPRGTQALREAIAHPSVVVVTVAAFQDLRSRVADLDDNEVEILRHACRHIRTNHWHGLTADAIAVEASLPAPVPPAVDPPVIDLPINLSNQGD